MHIATISFNKTALDEWIYSLILDRTSTEPRPILDRSSTEPRPNLNRTELEHCVWLEAENSARLLLKPILVNN